MKTLRRRLRVREAAALLLLPARLVRLWPWARARTQLKPSASDEGKPTTSKPAAPMTRFACCAPRRGTIRQIALSETLSRSRRST